MTQDLLKFIMGMKAECPPMDTPFLDTYYNAFQQARQSGMCDIPAQEYAVKAVLAANGIV
jgi:hypothetical protein